MNYTFCFFLFVLNVAAKQFKMICVGYIIFLLDSAELD